MRRNVVRYFCRLCSKSFSNSHRKNNQKEKIWEAYVWGKQTRKQLSKKYKKSSKTIERILDSYEIKKKKHNPRKLVVVMDATYFKKENGILVARDPNKKENIYCCEIISETKIEYQKAKSELEMLGYELQAIILDGKRGIPSVFKDIPVQLCQFHQWQVIRRKLTLKPKLKSHQELLLIARKITKSTESEMKKFLEDFEKNFHEELNEKIEIIETKKWKYVHKNLRSAYKNLVRNLPFLYTHEKYPELNIPNTTNSLDGFFNILKMFINIHRGLKSKRRIKVIKELLK